MENKRAKNLKLGIKSDELILNHLRRYEGIKIVEIRDGQRKGNIVELQGIEKLENDINKLLGIDYVVELHGKTYYVDTKGMSYNKSYNGELLPNGEVESLLIQVGKSYYGELVEGWGNNESYWTTHIIILLEKKLYYIDYKRLKGFIELYGFKYSRKVFRKGNKYELCLIVPISSLRASKVITKVEDIGELGELEPKGIIEPLGEELGEALGDEALKERIYKSYWRSSKE